jgi:predicted component of viral defense system (DUF524 family)
MITAKASETSISVDKVIPEKTENNIYEYSFLLSQREAIKAQAKDFADARQKELDEVEMLIAECEKLGIKEKVEVKVEEAIEPK